MRDLPDMYVQGPRPRNVSIHIRQIVNAHVHMLQVLCNTFIAIVTTPEGQMPPVIVTLVCEVISTNC